MNSYVNFIADLKEGEEKTFYENGNLASLYNYEKGQFHGLCQEWTLEGVKLLEAEYRNGKREGLFMKWEPSGGLRVKLRYENDVKVQEKPENGQN